MENNENEHLIYSKLHGR